MKENKLKEKNGFAIVSVVFLLFVLSLMGTAMFMYSITSLRSVRFLSNQKKAEYLAQAGVEAASYAYQLAVKSNNSTAVQLVAGTADEGGMIESNKVYMVYTGVDSEPYKYVKESELPAYSSENIIGYYEVEIESKPNVRVEKALKNDDPTTTKTYPVKISEGQRVFKAVGHTQEGNASATKRAYIAEPAQAMGKYYDATTGIIDGSLSAATETLEYVDENGQRQSATVPKATNTNFSVLGTYTTGSQLNVKVSLFNNIPFIGKYIGVNTSWSIPISQREIPILLGYTSGNMILNEPESGVIKFKPNQDNMVTLIGATNLFVNSDIDVTPSRKYFNTLFLKGNNIVINGDVEMYVYGFQKMRLFQNTANLINLFSQNYCLGNVVIGTPDYTKATNKNTIKSAKVAGNNEYTSYYRPSSGYGSCGKVFFGGNVFVNLEIPNVGTYRYRAFASGDAYYYDDDLPPYVDNTETNKGYGIDLFKYFIDYAVACGRYSENVNERLGQIMALYYSSGGKTPFTYVIGQDDGNGKPTGVITYNAMRKIDKATFGDSYASLIPPDPTDATALNWITG